MSEDDVELNVNCESAVPPTCGVQRPPEKAACPLRQLPLCIFPSESPRPPV